MPKEAVLVTGATGHQGRAVVNALLDANADMDILAVTRNAQSDAAQKLVQKSSKIKVVQGDLNNVEELFKSAKSATSLPIWGVFSVQTSVNTGQSVKVEEEQGKALVDQSIKEGVKFFVYTSVDRGGDRSFDNPTGISHFISKHNIEHHLVDKAQSSQMAWTILRPAAFFDNIMPGFMGKAFTTSWDIALKGKPLQLIAARDIGYFAAQAFLKPDEYRGKSISLAGDEITFDQAASIFKEKTGKPIPTTYRFLCWIGLWLLKDFGSMFKWFHDEGCAANIQELRKIHPELKDFSAWLEKDSEFVKQKST